MVVLLLHAIIMHLHPFLHQCFKGLLHLLSILSCFAVFLFVSYQVLGNLFLLCYASVIWIADGNLAYFARFAIPGETNNGLCARSAVVDLC